ncbi:MAG: adenosylcobinamide-GDP ribazoletransferase [Thermodesulfovibrionales bacterium]|nr:adenosylcobinamide-GDP ribazoletransferase [Thermodesulfovibrionales bacterium]
MKRYLLALQFLTIIPLKLRFKVTPVEIARSSPFFVPVGLFQGMVILSVLALSEWVFHQDLAIAIALLSYILLNGAFHLDGLADTFDAIAVKSTGAPLVDREKRLAVARESATGAIGVLAMVSVLFLKYLSLKNISHLIPSLYYLSFLLMPVVSKWTMNVAMFHGRPARTEGLGYLFMANYRTKDFLIAGAWLLSIYSLIYALFGHYLPERFYIFCIFVTLTLYLFSLLWLSFLKKRLGGQTGDTLGALNEISELIFLLLLILWWRFSISW